MNPIDRHSIFSSVHEALPKIDLLIIRPWKILCRNYSTFLEGYFATHIKIKCMFINLAIPILWKFIPNKSLRKCKQKKKDFLVQRVKDPMLSLQRLASRLWCGSGNIQMPWARPKKEKKHKKIIICLLQQCL